MTPSSGRTCKTLRRIPGLPAEDVIRLHAGATYEVCFLGFTAGFAYLGGMPEIEHAAPARRLDAPLQPEASGLLASKPESIPPRRRAVGGLIGRTPLRMFSARGYATIAADARRPGAVCIDRSWRV